MKVSWPSYLGLVAFFAVVFTVFYAVSVSVLSQVVENYKSYHLKAGRSWTGRGSWRVGPRRRRLLIVAALGLLTAWFVVRFVILK
jgi:hypothetical protein